MVVKEIPQGPDVFDRAAESVDLTQLPLPPLGARGGAARLRKVLLEADEGVVNQLHAVSLALISEKFTNEIYRNCIENLTYLVMTSSICNYHQPLHLCHFNISTVK